MTQDNMSNTCIDIAVGRVGETLSFKSARCGDGMSFTAERHGTPLSFKCGLVCSVGSEFYLRVEPEVIWLLPDSADVVVYSNVTWTVE